MQLSRLDLCRNVGLQDQRYIDAYIRLLKKGSSATGWKVQSYPEGDERNAHSFRRISRYYQVTVYENRKSMYASEEYAGRGAAGPEFYTGLDLTVTNCR